MLKRHAILIMTLLALAPHVAGQSPDDRYPVVINGKVGFIDYKGREVIPAKFGNAGDSAHFLEGLAPVSGPDGSGFIDVSGNFVVGPRKDWLVQHQFHEGIAAVLLVGKGGQENTPAWIDGRGSVLFSGPRMGESCFSEGLAPLLFGNKWGFVNNEFKIVIQPRFEWANEFSEGLAVVSVGSKWGFIDKSGKQVIAAKYSLAWPFRDGLGRVRIDIPNGTEMTEEGRRTRYRYKYGFVDHDGIEVIPLQFEQATYFSQGYALACPQNSALFGIINKAGEFVHPPEYEYAGDFHEGVSAVAVKAKWGYVDTSGSWVIQAAFEHADNFWHGLARVAWPDAYGYIDKRGQVVWKTSRAQ
jgi:hypothetical protein